MSVETEFKLLADPTFRMPDLTRAGVIASAVEVIDDVATYYDTNDFRLTRAGLSLRYRTSDGWTVKLPETTRPAAGTLVRHEHQFPGGPAVPPLHAIDLVQAQARSARLGPVLALVTRRERRMLADPDGIPIGELVDDLVSSADGDHPTLPFRELELEVQPDAPASLVGKVLGWLRAAGARSAPPRSKISRALGPRAQGAPDLEPLLAGPHPDLPTVVRLAIAGPVLALVRHDPGVRVGEDPEAVHQARVATRRLRSNLRTFRPLLDREWSEGLRERLASVAATLGEVRDADVLGARLRSHAQPLPPDDRDRVEEIVRALEHDRASSLHRLVGALRGPGYLTLLDDLVEAARHPRLIVAADADTRRELVRLVRRPWRIIRRAVDDLPGDPPDEQLHEVRILAKRARYAAEAVTPALGPPATAFARAMADVQELLGEHQDAVATAAWLRRYADGTRRPDLAFAAGELAEAEHEAALRIRTGWSEVWRRASRPKIARWLA